MVSLDKYSIIKKYIDEYDYYSLLECGAPHDEFDSYSCEFAEIIQEDSTIEEIANIIANRMDKAFGNEVSAEKFIKTARKIKNDLNNK